MRNFWICLGLFVTTPAFAEGACPILSDGETAVDCPWAEVARKLPASYAEGSDNETTMAAKAEQARAVLEKESPDLYASLRQDVKHRELLELWGESINFDELAKGEIVTEPLLLALESLSQAKPAGELHRARTSHVTPTGRRVTHAGYEHTYGYLFSTLKTPYGFKRARWVSGEIERGFGMKEGSLLKDGFLTNLTRILGPLAFGDSPKTKKIWDRLGGQYPAFPYQKTVRNELHEVFHFKDSKTVWKKFQLNTAFVHFLSTAAPEANNHLLIYSITDLSTNTTRLITAFPVKQDFVDAAMKPTDLGEEKPIVVRYNAFIRDLPASPLRGHRTFLLQRKF